MTSFEGDLTLKNGNLSHLTTLDRVGNATIVYEGEYAHINTKVVFGDLVVSVTPFCFPKYHVSCADFNSIKNLNFLYFQFSPSSHSIVIFIPVGLSFLLHLLQVLLDV